MSTIDLAKAVALTAGASGAPAMLPLAPPRRRSISEILDIGASFVGDYPREADAAVDAGACSLTAIHASPSRPRP